MFMKKIRRLIKAVYRIPSLMLKKKSQKSSEFVRTNAGEFFISLETSRVTMSRGFKRKVQRIERLQD